MEAVAEMPNEIESYPGYEIPFADPITAQLDAVVRTWDDLMRQRIRLENRAIDPTTGEIRANLPLELADGFIGPAEKKAQRKIASLIREHPMADWLEEAKTQGARVGTILTMIKHPHRFPGQKCTEGHFMLPTFNEGDPCPVMSTPEKGEEPEPCTGIVQPPRRGTGCRALWHMSGMYPVQVNGDARLARKVKGQQASYNTAAKTAILMPQGIAQQFYMQGSRYAEVYYEEKARLREKHPDRKDGWSETTARVIAAKAWLGDLLMEWKERVPLEGDRLCEIEAVAALTAVP